MLVAIWLCPRKVRPRAVAAARHSASVTTVVPCAHEAEMVGLREYEPAAHVPAAEAVW